MRRIFARFFWVFVYFSSATVVPAAEIDLRCVTQFSLGAPLGQLRVVPVALGQRKPQALLCVHSQDATVDPYQEMFFFPKDMLHLTALTLDGKVLWTRDLGRGVVPGTWFCPVFPFDLDGDGVDEIWLVGNPDTDHPLTTAKRHLERLDARTGRTLCQWHWPAPEPEQSPSHLYRHFIFGGYVHRKPVLVTAQGTYGAMSLQGWNADMTHRWEYKIAKDSPGARGSHMCAVVDLDGDDVDEVLWGERCIEFDQGRERFCADRGSYGGHSDVVQPVWDDDRKQWFIYTCRENGAAPRVVLFDSAGRRVWSDLDKGHMDMGWVARLGKDGRPTAMAIRIGSKTAGPQGFRRTGITEFVYDTFSGQPRKLDFSVFGTLPVDLNGDGNHELALGLAPAEGSVPAVQGGMLVKVPGRVVLGSKILDRPGEQLISYTSDGAVRIWADVNARDSAAAQRRYRHRFYQANQRLTATGANQINLGGL